MYSLPFGGGGSCGLEEMADEPAVQPPSNATHDIRIAAFAAWDQNTRRD
jgi:hypothetical protein